MITKDEYVQGKDTTGIKFECGKVVDIYNHLAFINLDSKVLRCNLEDLEII